MEPTTVQRTFAALSAALRAGALAEEAPLCLLYDLDMLRANLAALAGAFPAGTIHALAVKACPLAAVLDEARGLGFGAECASEGELELALRLGFPPERILFDSPAKTRPEIARALEAGVTLNID